MKDSTRHAVEDVRILWPHLFPMEKIAVCEALAGRLGVDDWWDVSKFVVDDSVDLASIPDSV